MTSIEDRRVAFDPKATGGEVAVRRGRLYLTGAAATMTAMLATSVTTFLSKAAGVDFELPDGGKSMPWTGVALTTGVFCVVGVLIAAALRRWSAYPRKRFLATTITLTTISLVPPFLAEANTPTVTALLLIHLVAAAVMIPALTRALAR